MNSQSDYMAVARKHHVDEEEILWAHARRSVGAKITLEPLVHDGVVYNEKVARLVAAPHIRIYIARNSKWHQYWLRVECACGVQYGGLIVFPLGFADCEMPETEAQNRERVEQFYGEHRSCSR